MGFCSAECVRASIVVSTQLEDLSRTFFALEDLFYLTVWPGWSIIMPERTRATAKPYSQL